jgi:hypothetical protein
MWHARRQLKIVIYLMVEWQYVICMHGFIACT